MTFELNNGSAANLRRSLASLLPPVAEGGCARRHAMSARPLWYRSLRSTYPTGVGGSPAAPLRERYLNRPGVYSSKTVNPRDCPDCALALPGLTKRD